MIYLPGGRLIFFSGVTNPNDVLDKLCSLWTNFPKNGQSQFLNLAAAFKAKSIMKLSCRQNKKRVLQQIGLGISPGKRENTLLDIRQLICQKRSTPFPSPSKWIVENSTILSLWQNHILKGKQPDTRL